MKSELQLLKEANDILRSVSAIINRKGETTNWEGINKVVKMALAEQHELLLEKNCYISDVSGSAASLTLKEANEILKDIYPDIYDYPNSADR